jgi:hypothetical protein
MSNFIDEAEKSHSYSVFQIKNEDKKSKNRNHKFYVVSKLEEPEAVLNMVRSMAYSPTAGGGTKEISSDMKKVGKDYKEKYSVTKVKGGLSKEKANILKSTLIDKAGAPKVYNQIQPVN